ncbi:MAG: hypothetical protein ACN6I7_04000 [bacterium]
MRTKLGQLLEKNLGDLDMPIFLYTVYRAGEAGRRLSHGRLEQPRRRRARGHGGSAVIEPPSEAQAP